MKPKQSKFILKQLEEHSKDTRANWRKICNAISNVELPVSFHKSDSSMAVLANEKLDEECFKEFWPVHEFIEEVNGGSKLIHEITHQDAEDVIGSIESGGIAPTEPEGSVRAVSEFCNSVLSSLRTLTSEPIES